MIDTEALRKKVIDLAIQGKLTQQLPEDGNAEDLYAQIQKEKEKLIKEGKIKKEKQLLDITDDEIPFEIPNNWKFVRFSTIITLQSGQDLNSSEYNSEKIGIPYITGSSNYGDEGTIIINRWTDFPKAIALHGDILLSCKGTVGKIAILDEPRVHIARQIMGIRTYSMNVRYIRYFIERMVDGIKEASKGLIPGIERNDVLKLCCPIPPLSEQERIVNVIETAISELDTIDVLQQQYESDREILKGKIIDAGIRGMLTEQLPEDGNAEDLYAHIQKEKAKLIKEGKIKKEKPLPEISDDEIPFEIPKNWKWVRIGHIFSLQSGKNKTASDIHSEKNSEYKYQCYGGNGLRGYVDKANVSGKHILIGRQGALCGNINVADDEFWATEHAVVVYQYGNTDVDCYEHMFRALDLNQYATSVAQPGLAVGNIVKVLIPLPPLSEQKRISRRIAELLSVIT